MKVNFKHEAEICLLMESYLRDLKWQTYKEVTVPTGIIDIVGKQGAVLWGVEAKMSAGMALLEQATSRLKYCHRVSVVVPCPTSNFFQKICRREGIGIFTARHTKRFCPESRDFVPYGVIEETTPAAFRRKVIPIKLHDSMMSTTAGLPSPERVTPFTLTCNQIREVLQGKPEGLRLKDLIDNIQHHYRTSSTAKSSLAQWMRNGTIKGVRYENGRAYLETQGDAA
jgi:hypothetical protein